MFVDSREIASCFDTFRDSETVSVGWIMKIRSALDLGGTGGALRITEQDAQTSAVAKRILAWTPRQLPLFQAGKSIRHQLHPTQLAGNLGSWLEQGAITCTELVCRETDGHLLASFRFTTGGVATPFNYELTSATFSFDASHPHRPEISTFRRDLIAECRKAGAFVDSGPSIRGRSLNVALRIALGLTVLYIGRSLYLNLSGQKR